MWLKVTVPEELLREAGSFRRDVEVLTDSKKVALGRRVHLLVGLLKLVPVIW